MILVGCLYFYVIFYLLIKCLFDDDNMLVRFKFYWDGIVDVLGIDDKWFISYLLVSMEVCKGGQVVVRIIGGLE